MTGEMTPAVVVDSTLFHAFSAASSTRLRRQSAPDEDQPAHGSLPKADTDEREPKAAALLPRQEIPAHRTASGWRLSARSARATADDKEIWECHSCECPRKRPCRRASPP